MIYRAIKGRFCYGYSIGILKFDSGLAVSIPGCVGNATTYDFPVYYKKIDGVRFDSLYRTDPDALPRIIKSAKELESIGVKAITSGCGFFSLYQKEVANAVNIPVFLSPLLQVPFCAKCLGDGKKVGILTADSRYLDKDFLHASGITDDIPIVIQGLQNKPFFKSHVLDGNLELNEDEVCQEVSNAAQEMLAADSSIGTLLLECSELPPYAYEMQRRLGIPVYDFYTMIQYVSASLVRTPFLGYM